MNTHRDFTAAVADNFQLTIGKIINSFFVKSVYLRTVSISSDGTAETRTLRACEGVYLIPVESVALFCFRARLARKCERSDRRVNFYSTPSRITILYRLNLRFRKFPTGIVVQMQIASTGALSSNLPQCWWLWVRFPSLAVYHFFGQLMV